MIKYTVGFTTTNVTISKFPDGAVGVDINVGGKPLYWKHVNIEVLVQFGHTESDRGALLSVNDVLAALYQTVEAIRSHYPNAKLELICPYAPYARQDRVFKPGNAIGARFFANMINGMGFDAVVVVDPHSDVTSALLNNVHVMDQFEVFKNIYPSFGNVHIVAPDLGAVKKAQSFADKVGAAGVIICTKERDSDGKPTVKVISEVPSLAHLLVLDDICDGGATFKEVSQALVYQNDVARLELAVTHGIFSAGISEILDYYDKIHTTDSFISYKDDARINVIELA